MARNPGFPTGQRQAQAGVATGDPALVSWASPRVYSGTTWATTFSTFWYYRHTLFLSRDSSLPFLNIFPHLVTFPALEGHRCCVRAGNYSLLSHTYIHTRQLCCVASFSPLSCHICRVIPSPQLLFEHFSWSGSSWHCAQHWPGHC